MSQSKGVALVTGAGQNIGRALAVQLARDGFDLVVNGLSNRAAADETGNMVRAEGREAVIAMGDTGKPDDCAAMLAAAAPLGDVSVLVHNAAVRPAAPFLEMSEADWTRVMDINLSGGVWLARAVLPAMVAKGWGRIVLFAGMNAIHGYNGRAATSVSKHGLWGLAKSLGKEFGARGITTNIVSPGPIASEHADPEMTAHIEGMKSRVPVGRLGQPAEVASMVSLLVSEQGGFINGQMLQVNGGAET
ncbi:MAG: SDR family oxidoreductase [Pseudomonadota bacterium]